ncbi:MAG: D-Ala-D-Ala carboxypeptidase family metallohydrolase [Rickettsiales bacterium]|nr:D-Ala-D-Ala carboxypeptidase family metallohydrolase [Rickettsiales bacterium]
MYEIKNLQTKNFKPLDFFKSNVAKANNIDNLGQFLKQPNHQEMLLNGIHLANRMQKLRGLLNDIYKNKIGKEITIVINSAYRCPKINSLVGGSQKSQHMQLQACDFYSPELENVRLGDILRAVKEAKFEVDQMLVEETWIHFSCKLQNNRNMFGTYLYDAKVGKRVFKAI